MSIKTMYNWIEETISAVKASYAVNGVFLGVGTFMEQYLIQLIALTGLLVTVFFNLSQRKRDKERLEMEREDHLLHLREHQEDK